jgi:hypothetical protein
MHPHLFQHYKIKLKELSSNQKIEIDKITNISTKENFFSYPATNNKGKLYLVKYKGKIIYVGITSQPIIKRLKNGLNPNEKYGYHGYAWRKLKNIDLFLWCNYGKDKDKSDEIKKMETIEAEIVFFIRSTDNEWPQYQTEIHFHKATEEQKIMAKAIYTIAKKKK